MRLEASPRVRVLLLCDQLDVRGGVERFVCVLSNGLDREGFDVAVGSVDTNATEVRYQLNPGIRVLVGDVKPRVRHLATDTPPRMVQLWRMFGAQWRTSKALRRVIRTHHPDVIVFNGMATACVVLAAAPRWATRSICCDHNHFAARSKSWQRLRAWVYPKVAAVISLTEADAPKFRELNPRTYVIRNASSLRADFPSLPASPVVLAVGRLVAQKGIDLLLRAWVQVAAELPKARLHVVGDGPLRSELQCLAEELHINDSVEWLGETDDVARQYRDAALFVLPSRYEGMPLALLEAQAMGVPAVVFDCPTGPAEIVVSDTGIVLPPMDISAMASAILSLLSQPELRERKAWAALHRSAEVFSVDRQLQQWAQLIKDVSVSSRPGV